MNISIEPKTITDVTQRLRLSIDKPVIDSLRVNGYEVPFFADKLPQNKSLALFFIEPDLIATGIMEVEVEAGGENIKAHIQSTGAAKEEARKLVEIRESKRAWLEANSYCPECGSNLIFRNGIAACERGHEFPQKFHCVNLLSQEISDQAKLAGGKFVSRHLLGKPAHDIIEYVKQKGGMALDFGAGLKFVKDYHPSVVNLEIEPYPTTDIVAAGQNLPFKNNTFDGIFSFSVLEHVSDPFQCATEIARVLKPGGRICIAAPFLFHEHGYPEHYYNMTRRGIANLFENNLEITAQRPGRICIPSLLKSYHKDLSKEAAEKFEKMTIGDIVRAPLAEADLMAQTPSLSSEMKWRYAHGTYLWATKKP